MQGNVNIPDSNITTNLTFRELVLMNMQQLTNFPYIENDFDALTDYELLCLVVKFLNDVIANQNEQNDSITRMYESFLALQTYVNNTKDTLEDAFNTLDNYVRTFFENLDVQDEIDHKLDEMVEDGTLEHIIASYLQTQKIYSTHVEMIADASNLVDGLTVQTLGYYAINDGGGAFYKITDTESLTEYQEEIGTDLYATLIINEYVTPEMFGAKGDDLTDDQDAINLAINSGANKIIFKSKNYKVRGYEENQPEGGTLTDLSGNTGILLKSNITIDLNGATIKCIANNRKNYNIFTLQSVHNVCIKNGNIEGDSTTHTGNLGEWGYGIALRDTNNIILKDLYITKCWGDGINIKGYLTTDIANNSNIIISNCTCDDNRRQGMSIEHGQFITIEDSSFINTGSSIVVAPGSGVDIEPASFENVNDCYFNRCKFNNNYGSGIDLIDSSSSDLSTHNVYNITIDSCVIKNNDGTNIQSELLIQKASNTIVKNCLIEGTDTQYGQMVARMGGNCDIINNTFNNFRIIFNGLMAENCKLNIVKNTFNYNKSAQYNGIIEQTSYTGTHTGNTASIINNRINIMNKSLNVALGISMKQNGFTFANIENNYIQYTDIAISVKIPSLIKNNIIVAPKYWAIQLVNDSYTCEINNNHIERSGTKNNGISPFSTDTDPVTVILNNTYYSYLVNTALTIDQVYTDHVSQWVTTTPTNLTSENNNIIS